MKYSDFFHKQFSKLYRGLSLAAAAALIFGFCTPARAVIAGNVGVSAGTGALLVYGTTTKFNVRGLITIGVLYPAQYASAMCTNLDSTTQSELAAVQATMTEQTETQIKAMKNDWYANTVRIMVSQGALTYEYENGLSAYTNMVMGVINEARTLQMVVIVAMQTEAYSCTPERSDGQLQRLPDQLTEEAWEQLAPHVSGDRAIMVDFFNEPQTSVECGTQSWTNWETGCNSGVGPDQGMIPVGNYVRGLLTNNVMIYEADNGGGTFAGFTDTGAVAANSVYTVHPFYYYYPASGGQTALQVSTSNWDSRFGNLQAAGHTVLTTSWDESGSCPADTGQTVTTNLIDTYMPAHHMGLILFAWDSVSSSATGYLVNPTTFAPVDPNSVCITGATLANSFFKTQSGN